MRPGPVIGAIVLRDIFIGWGKPVGGVPWIEKQWSCCLGNWSTGSSETETDLGDTPEGFPVFSPHLETASRLYARH